MPAHAPAKRHCQPQQNQGVERRRQDAAQARHGIERAAKEQRAAAAQAIGDGAIDQLPDGQADEEGGQRLLHIGGFDTEVVGDRRQTRQVHVYRQGTKRGENPQDDGETSVGMLVERRRWLCGQLCRHSEVPGTGGGFDAALIIRR